MVLLRAGEARRHAENLESSLKGKQRSGNLGLQAAQKEAKVAAEEAQRAKKQATEVAWLYSEKVSIDIHGVLLLC